MVIERRFWAKAERQSNGCWFYAGGRDKDGYGIFDMNGKSCRAHRVALILRRKVIPPKGVVMHECDNPPCIRPTHLRIATQRENDQDAISKGRRRPTESGIGNFNRQRRGEKHHKAALSNRDVLAIRSSSVLGKSARSLAKKYGVNKSTISRVVNRETWTHL